MMAVTETEVQTNISEDEAALYDRQIRLWGLEAQKRLRESSILVAGMGGLGAEVTKNLILAGVKSITLLDHNIVKNGNNDANFLSDQSFVGKNRAESCRGRAQDLNPMVDVRVDPDPLETKEDEFFRSFAAVCVLGHPRETLSKVNAACHRFGVKFFAGDVWGYDGFVFADLVRHTYLHERVVHQPKTSNSDGEPVVKKPHVEEQVEVTKKTVDYITLEKALAVKSGKSGTGLAKRTPPVLYLVHVMLRFLSRMGRSPSAEHLEEDRKELLKLREDVICDLGIDAARFSEDFVKSVFGELSPVCAVVGGILAQDVIKVVSEKGTPIINFFLFDGNRCTGVVEHIGL